jgi:Gas vesicle synthesis protein GvpL/GvpF
MSPVYVYGILPAGARPGLRDRGVDGRPLGVVAHGDLAALVGEGVEEPVRPSRRNVLAHSGVLQHAVAAGLDVLPMQFGVVMPDAARVRDELLTAHAGALRAQLAEHAGRVELDVTLTAPEDAVLRRVIRGDARLAQAVARLRGSGD